MRRLGLSHGSPAGQVKTNTSIIRHIPLHDGAVCDAGETVQVYVTRNSNHFVPLSFLCV